MKFEGTRKKQQKEGKQKKTREEKEKQKKRKAEETVREALKRMHDVLGENKIKHQVYGSFLHNLGYVLQQHVTLRGSSFVLLTSHRCLQSCN